MARPPSRLRAAIVAVVGLAACGRAPSREPTGDHPIANRGATVAIDAAPAPFDADAWSACVAACVQSRQMEAVSIEYIRTTCDLRCRQPPPAP